MAQSLLRKEGSGYFVAPLAEILAPLRIGLRCWLGPRRYPLKSQLICRALGVYLFAKPQHVAAMPYQQTFYLLGLSWFESRSYHH